jgi:osmoprotectant transport system substrate-binding protein
LERAYGFEFGRDRVVRVDTSFVYQVLRDLKLLDVGLVFATDGRISAYNLLVLKDDKGFFPSYAMAPVVRKEILDRHPDLAEHLGRVSALLDNDAMSKLNAIVDVDNIRIPQVAAEFLRGNGLI